MRFFIIDDDESVRWMLSHIIEEEGLGTVVGEASDGMEVDEELLNLKNVDILLIDLLMPIRDGIETVQDIKPEFSGKIIMISQIESKDLIGHAYLMGIDYYITKPINKIEVVSVIQKVMEHIHMERSIQDIQRSLQNAMNFNLNQPGMKSHRRKSLSASTRLLLSELGIAGESGSKDLIEIMQFLYDNEKEQPMIDEFPPLKEIFRSIALKKLGESANEDAVKKEVKASEQRVRRAVYASLNNLASLGLTDFSHPKFENYSSKFFEFNTVRQKMKELKGKHPAGAEPIRINLKKFIQALYFEIQHLMLD